MDVTCDRCSTEYEFEEALVSPRGTTVKCTQCGHLFKVYRPEAPTSPQPLESQWSVRRTDGSNHKLPSLADLTRLIGEGAFTRDDEVSRTGKAWRRLGDIEELETFFAEADRRGPSRARRATQGPVLGLAVPKATPTTPVERSPRPADAALGSPGTGAPRANAPASASHPARSEGANESWHAASPRPSTSAAVSGSESATIDNALATDEDDVKTEQRELPLRTPAAHSGGPLALPGAQPARSSLVDTVRARPSQPTAAAHSAPSTPLRDLDDDRALDEPRPRSWRGLWFVALGSLVAGALLWWFWPMPALPRVPAGLPEDPSVQFLARADEAFATQRLEHFEQAITEYTMALAFHESDPHVLSSLSRVYAVWTQELRFNMRGDERDPDNGKNVTRRANQVAAESQAQKLAAQAKSYAELAARHNPGNGEAEVALSDALRLTSNLVGARSELDRALASDKDPNAETLRVEALLTIDEAGGDARAGLALASKAVAKEPELLRTQLLLARCLVGDGDLVGARYHLHAVTTRDRDHPSALAVEHMIAHLSDAKPQRDAAAESDKDKDKDKAKEKSATEEPGAQYDNLSHEAYITRGQALLEAGQVAQAKRMFEQALFIRPNSSQAHAGLGYVALEKGRPLLAAEHFMSAVRSGNDDALIGLGDAYRRLQRPRDALHAYQNYLAHSPNGPQASIARAQLERLGDEAQAKKAQ